MMRCVVIALLLSGLCSGTTSCTSQLNGADNGILGVHQLQALEVEVAYSHGLAQTQSVDVDHQTPGNLVVQSLNLQLTHGQRQLTTGLYTLGMTLDLYGYLHNDGLVRIYLQEIDVEQSILDGLELQVLDNGLDLLAVQVDVNLEDVGSIDQLAYVIGVNHDVSGDDATLGIQLDQFLTLLQSAVERKLNQSATVDDCGNLTLLTQGLHRLLTQLCTRLGVQCILLHFLFVVLLKTRTFIVRFPITRDFCAAKLRKKFHMTKFSRQNH